MAAQAASAEVGHPVLATVSSEVPADTLRPDAKHQKSAVHEDVASSRSPIVEAGDTVIVRFADDNRVRWFRLSMEANSPEQGVVHVEAPLGEVLLGNGVKEEVALVVEGRVRTVIIEKIMKSGLSYPHRRYRQPADSSRMPLKTVPFLCSRNRLRSPTAEQVFGQRTDIEVTSAGLNNDADTVCTPELLERADVVFVMER